jgi:hypothetical protein
MPKYRGTKANYYQELSPRNALAAVAVAHVVAAVRKRDLDVGLRLRALEFKREGLHGYMIWEREWFNGGI